MAKDSKVLINYDNKTIYIGDFIDKDSMADVNWALIYMMREDDKNDEEKKDFKRKPILIYINSRGGSLYDMWSLVDLMKMSKTPIHTYCTGYAFSAGFKIFLAGHERFATRNSVMMYHQLSSGFGGCYADIKEQTTELDRNQEDVESFVLSETKITAKKLKEIRDTKTDWYIHSEDYEKFGIATLI